MKHWPAYLQRQRSEYLKPPLPVECIADMIVVIPCFNEKKPTVTLNSLIECNSPGVNTQVVIVINSTVQSNKKAIQQNRETYQEVLKFSKTFSTHRLHFVPIIVENLPKKHGGVGLARKIGMDLAVDHFYKTNNPEGILISLDADCTVSKNYLRDIYEAFQNKKVRCTIHNFHHRTEDNNETIEKAIREYEGYLRYFEKSLKYTGFPYYYHTIGSAFAVTADAYVCAGGMGRQQGGEDFYFLHKIFPMGKVAVLDNVFVYPMARFSERVPFGTGPALQKIIAEPDGRIKVYSMDAFAALKEFFDKIDLFFKQPENAVAEIITLLHPSLQEFIQRNNMEANIMDCNDNCATLVSFRKRFFQHFNAFNIIKYLNYSHREGYFDLESLATCNNKYSKYIGN
ncbi:MAG: glycosyltransferase [Dysgonamonadaceae bacterium]|jgi:glycosyltransferase involved in cell wall biosynthesis|nr:glycosyltransferase [Dysgonamonadaceae bacterium]